MKLPLITTFMIATSFLMVTITEAQIYKWKDAKGQIHYASTPPKPGEKNIDLKKDFSFSAKTTATKTDSNPKKEDKPLDTATNDKTENKPKIKLQFCKKQQQNLELLRKNSSVTWIEKGKETQLSGEMIKDKIQFIKESMKKNCTSAIKQ